MITLRIHREPINITTPNVDVSFEIYFTQIQDTNCKTDIVIGNPRVEFTNEGNVFIPTTTFNDNFGEWITISGTINNTENNEIGFINVLLDFTQGLSDCGCNYTINIRNVQINETKIEENIFQIPLIGFNSNNLGDSVLEGLQRVIDNKKSWVYNPGSELYGVKEFDDIVRENGDFGLIQGHGSINRTFAPSPDAEIPFRTTDYLEQSSILEHHSELVINSKELFLTFNMSATGSCPEGYTFISGDTCSKTVTICPSGTTKQQILDDDLGLIEKCFYLSNNALYGDPDTNILFTEVDSKLCNVPSTPIYLEEYKKTFQSFWVKMVEQFIPATTIFISGEKWANNPNEICSEIEECDLTNELTSADIVITDKFGNKFTLSQTDVSFITNTTGQELQITTSVTTFDVEYQGNTQNNLNNKGIYYDALKVVTLQDNLNNNLIFSEPLIVENYEEKVSFMDDYINAFNAVQTQTVFV
jgi:hypothetical protein